MADGPARALPLIDALSGPLSDYYLWHAARADLLRRLGRTEAAIQNYRRAHELAQNASERQFLAGRLAELGG